MLSEFNTFDVKLSVITVCLTVIFNIVGPRNLLKTVDRLRLCKYCYHLVYFPVIVWSPSVTCLALHKTYVCRLLHLIPKTHIVTIFWSISVKRQLLVYCSCKCLKSFTDWCKIRNGYMSRIGMTFSCYFFVIITKTVTVNMLF